MTAEPMVLRCTCGVEVRLVRLNPETLTFGHVANPRNNRHPVRLSRPADDDHGLGAVGSRRLTEAPVTVAPVPGASFDRTATGTRSAPNGRSLEPHRRKSASGIASSPAGRARRAEVRPPDSVPRLARSAGSVT